MCVRFCSLSYISGMSEQITELLLFISMATLIILGVGYLVRKIWLMKGLEIQGDSELSKIIPLWFILILFIVALVHFW
jgi:hypothetical protein